MTPKIVEFEGTRVAVLEHRGPRGKLMQSVQRFIEWRKSCDVSPEPTSKTIGIPYGDPDDTEPDDDCRFDICGTVVAGVPENEFGVVEKVIPAGRCAVVRHLGSTETIGDTVHALYSQWLPDDVELANGAAPEGTWSDAPRDATYVCKRRILFPVLIGILAGSAIGWPLLAISI